MAVVSHINHQGGSRSRTLDRQSSPLGTRQGPLPEMAHVLQPIFCRDRSSDRGGMDAEPRNSSLCVVPMPTLVLPEFPSTSGHRCVRSLVAEPETVYVSTYQADFGSPVQGEGEQGSSPARSPVLSVPDVVLGDDYSSGSPSVQELPST